jgi:putative ABC transport system ATP-binding protein
MAPALLARFRQTHVGFVFQGNNLIDVLTASENIALPLSLRRMGASERHRRTEALIDELGLRSVAARRPCELSGGQQQRVSIARALVTEPSIVLADEPTAHLDAQTAVDVMHVLRAIHESRGTTLIFSTHDPAVEVVATARYILRSGRIVAALRREEIAIPCDNWHASPFATSAVVLDAH